MPRIVFLILLLIPLLPTLALAQAPCTHYASPSGSGSACSQASPCKIEQFWGHASPGKTLCLLDGTYSGEASMILPPQSVKGTASQPVTIRALNDGKVTLNANGYFAVLLGNNDGSGNAHMVIEGINAHTGGEALYRIRGSNNTLKRVIGWDGTSGQADSNIFRFSGQANWCEDCAGWGRNSRKIMDFAQGGNVGGGGYSRGWAEWNDHPQGESNPNNTWLISYGTGNARFFNILGTWRGLGDVGNAEGVMEIARTCDENLDAEGTLVKGALLYTLPDTTVQSNKLVSGFCASGFHLEDVAAIAAGQSHVRPFVFEKGGALQPSGSVCKNCLGVHSGSPSSNSGTSGWSTPGFREGPSLPLATAGTPAMQLLPGLCKQYDRSGTLTDKPLWPWPMNQRIKDARQASGYPQVDVTATVETLLGPIPPACRSGAGPGPGPSPIVPVPPTNVTATAHGAQVVVEWVDDLNTNAMGYTVERNVGTGGYTEISRDIPPASRAHIDLSPVLGQENCYVVYAQGAAGPSRFSEPGCVAVPGTPRPPEPPVGTPLACVGIQAPSGVIAVACTPESGKRAQEGRR